MYSTRHVVVVVFVPHVNVNVNVNVDVDVDVNVNLIAQLKKSLEDSVVNNEIKLDSKKFDIKNL